MDAKQIIALAKGYLKDLLADEQISSVGLEEIEHHPELGTWSVTLSFSRPWNTPKTRAQELLESLNANIALKRSSKIMTLSDDGSVLSMKNQVPADAIG